MIDDRTDDPPVRGNEQLLLEHWSRRNSSEGHFPLFGDLYYGHNFLLFFLTVKSLPLSRPRNMRPESYEIFGFSLHCIHDPKLPRQRQPLPDCLSPPCRSPWPLPQV